MDTPAEPPHGVVAAQPASTPGLPVAVRTARLALGAVLNAIALVDRVEGAEREPRRWAAADLGLGIASLGYAAGSSAASLLVRVTSPVVNVALHPPLLNPDLAPAAFLEGLRARGEMTRAQARFTFDRSVTSVAPELTRTVMARLDVTDAVLATVDLKRVVAAVLDEMDLTKEILDRVDLRAVVMAVVRELDLTEIVLDSVDLDRIVESVDLDAAVKQVDLDAVAAQMDLVGIAEYIVDAIDLPEIIQTSTGSVATEMVKGARLRSFDADEQAQRIVDRVLLRRRHRNTRAPDDADATTKVASNGDGRDNSDAQAP